jgi:DNA primase
MRISQSSIDEVRETADIVEVASEFTALRRQGARMSGLCPYPDHDEKTPSFSVSPDRNLFHCFGCNKGGDSIKLVMDLKALPFTEAISYLAERSGIDLKYEGSASDARAAQQRTERRRKIHKALAAAAVYYHKVLLQSKSSEVEVARNYLRDRGLHLPVINEFRLGYSLARGRGFLDIANKLGLERSVLEAAGLLSSRGGERFFGRITFPISDRRGRMVGLGARALGDAKPKYLNSPETEIFAKRELLYGLPQVMEAVRKERTALVVEGYTDVLMLYQAGIRNAVATLGTATTPAHLRVLSGYADRIFVLFDPDAAGEKATERAAATAAELKVDLRVLRLTEDPADWLLEHPPEEFRDLLSGATPVLEYTIRRIADRLRGAGVTDRSRAVPEVQSLLREIRDPVLRREAIRLATEALGVGPEVFRNSSPREPVEVGSTRNQGNRERAASPIVEAGRDVLAIALARPDLAASPIRDGVAVSGWEQPLRLEPADFGDPGQADLFSLLRDHAGEDFGRVLSDERARPLMDQIGALSSEGEKLFPSSAAVREVWLRLRILNRQKSKRETEDYDAKACLQEEIQALSATLRSIGPES